MPIVEATDADFERLLADHENVVVKYFADWCGYCRLFAPRFGQLAALPRYAGLTFVQVNAELNPQARRLGRVSYLPFFATFRHGRLVESLSSTDVAVVAGLLDQLTGPATQP